MITTDLLCRMEAFIHTETNEMPKFNAEQLKGSPTAEQVKKARADSGLTQRECAQIVGYTLNAWQRWEQGDHPMRPTLWELFLSKTKKMRLSTPEALPNVTGMKGERGG